MRTGTGEAVLEERVEGMQVIVLKEAEHLNERCYLPGCYVQNSVLRSVDLYPLSFIFSILSTLAKVL